MQSKPIDSFDINPIRSVSRGSRLQLYAADDRMIPENVADDDDVVVRADDRWRVKITNYST